MDCNKNQQQQQQQQQCEQVLHRNPVTEPAGWSLVEGLKRHSALLQNPLVFD
jgi:hypothetical protein